MRNVLLLVFVLFIFIGCAKEPSSYKNDSAQWQQFKSKQAEDKLERE